MNNGFFAMVVLVIIIVFGGTILYVSDVVPELNDSIDLALGIDDGISNVSLNKTVKNITENTTIGVQIKNNKSSVDKGVIATQLAPSKAKEGSNITIVWKVKNYSNKKITGVKGIDQNYEYRFGSLNPGDVKSINYSFYIPSVEDLKNAGFGLSEDYDKENLYIGGFSLSYHMNGKKYKINSNEVVINMS